MNMEAWWDKYRPVKNHIDKDSCYSGCMFETHGPEDQYVRSVVEAAPERVWTLIDVDGKGLIVPEYRLSDRQGYFVTEMPCDPADEIVEIEVYDDEDTPKDELLAYVRALPDDGRPLSWAIIGHESVEEYVSENLPDVALTPDEVDEVVRRLDVGVDEVELSTQIEMIVSRRSEPPPSTQAGPVQ